MLGWIVLCAVAATCPGDDEGWTRFRGPNGSGVARVTGLPEALDPATNLVWRVPLARGFSSPVLFADRIYLTAEEGDELVTLSLSQVDGRTLWKRVAPRPRREKLDGRNDPASPSAAVDADVVIVFFPEFGLLAYDHAGTELWRRELGPFDNVYGMGASPILAGKAAYLACDQQTGSFLLAVDKRTGATLWRAERPEAKSGHCTPIVHAEELLLPGSFYLDAYDLATGVRRWRRSGLSFEMKSVPVITGGLVLVNGYGSPMNDPGNQIEVESFEAVVAARDADGDGAIAKDEMPATRAAAWFDFVDLGSDGRLDARDWSYLSDALASQNGLLAFRLDGGAEESEALAWSYRRSIPQLPSPVVLDDVLYLLNDGGGLLLTFRPATGELLERGRVAEAIDTYYASPVAGDGKVYLASEHGSLVVLPAGGSFEPLSVVELDENVYATPALAQGRVFVRSVEALYAFGAPEPKADER